MGNSPKPEISRRAMLGGSFGALFATTAFGSAAPAHAGSLGTVLPLVPYVAPRDIDRKLFSPQEQIYGRYLLIVAPLANSVVDDREAEYGWMEDGWWRDENRPDNARIMEHIYTLAWFYANERPWNPYYLNEALLGRLDAAIGYYLSLQFPNGAIPHLGRASLAATGFGVISILGALEELRRSQALPERQVELETAARAGAAWLSSETAAHWTRRPLEYYNQIIAGILAVVQTARILDDATISERVPEMIGVLQEHGVAPAGYFHEPTGLDANYNWIVALPDLAELYDETGDERLITMAQKLVENYSYATVMEPESLAFTHFSTASARTTAHVHQINLSDHRDALAMNLLGLVPEAAPFFLSAEQRVGYRQAWSANSAPLTRLPKGSTSPRTIRHVPRAVDGPSEDLRREQIAKLPYLASSRFTTLRKGTEDQHALYVRRPGYYAASLLGTRRLGRTKSGTGLLWHPKFGILLLSLNRYYAEGPEVAWTTVQGTTHSSQLGTSSVGYGVAGEAVGEEVIDRIRGDFSNSYSSKEGQLQSEVSYGDTTISKRSTVAGEGVEMLPLLLRPSDIIEFPDGATFPGDVDNLARSATGFAILRDELRISFDWGQELPLTLAWDKVGLFGGTDQMKRLNVMRVAFTDEITVNIDLPAYAVIEPPEEEPEAPVDPPEEVPGEEIPPAPEETLEPTPEPGPTFPSPTAIPTATATAIATATGIPTATASPTVAPSPTLFPSPTFFPTPTAAPLPTQSTGPSASPTASVSPSATPTGLPTSGPTVPTSGPTVTSPAAPSATASPTGSASPTGDPTASGSPTGSPSPTAPATATPGEPVDPTVPPVITEPVAPDDGETTPIDGWDGVDDGSDTGTETAPTGSATTGPGGSPKPTAKSELAGTGVDNEGLGWTIAGGLGLLVTGAAAAFLSRKHRGANGELE